MNTISQPPPVLTPQVVDDPRASLQPGREPKKLAQEFESVFIAMLIKEMRQSSTEGGLFAGDASDTYGALFDMTMARHMAENGGIGLAETIAEALEKQAA